MPPPAFPAKPTKFMKPDGSTFTVSSVPGFLGLGLTGIVLQHGNNALKIPRLQVTTDLPEDEQYYVESTNQMNEEQLENEKRIFQRLGSHIGIIPCIQISAEGIEIAYIKNGTLEDHIKNQPPAADVLKATWLRSVVDTLFYIHERGVIVNDIALRNILVGDDLSLHFIDFGHSSLQTLDPNDRLSANERVESSPSMSPNSGDGYDESAIQVDIFQLASVMYSITAWKKYEYNLYPPAPADVVKVEISDNRLMCSWPSVDDLPDIKTNLCSNVILKGWMRKYSSVQQVRDEVYLALSTI